MKCDICNSEGVHIRNVTRTYGKGEELLIIENLTIISCPHCQFFIIIEQINCAIFRHGVLKESGEQINPHLDRESCENLIEQNKIFGCGK
ncbi:MAG: YgiT-type zinc finger protein [Dolichospermum sp.]